MCACAFLTCCCLETNDVTVTCVADSARWSNNAVSGPMLFVYALLLLDVSNMFTLGFLITEVQKARAKDCMFFFCCWLTIQANPVDFRWLFDPSSCFYSVFYHHIIHTGTLKDRLLPSLRLLLTRMESTFSCAHTAIAVRVLCEIIHCSCSA
jgi:hypothetical protein